MKLPISLLMLAALSQALSVPVTKRSEVKTIDAKTTETKDSAAKSSDAKQAGNNLTSKRELFEGNYGDRNKELTLNKQRTQTKHEIKGPPPRIIYAKELQEMISDQPPAHQMFGVRLPQIAKISDVLSAHGPSYEDAVARQLYSPVALYQPIHPFPASFEVPTPTASQSSHSKLKAFTFRYAGHDKHKFQGVPTKSAKTTKTVELANPPPPLYTVNQAKVRFNSHPQPLNSGLARQHEGLPEETFPPQDVSGKDMPLLYPLYEQLGPFKYPAQVVPLQHSNHRHGIFQIFPVAKDFDKNYKDGNRDKDYPSEENYEQLTRPKFQIDIPLHKQGYHAHPNGAISFARFTHDLHGITQHNTAPQAQSETFHQPQPAQYQSQAIPIQLPQQIQPELMMQSQEQKLTPGKPKLPFSPMLQGLIQELEKYQPVYQQQPHYNPFSQQMQYPPRTFNALQQHLLFQEPQQSSNLQIIQLPRLPAFKPIPESLLTPEPYLKKTGRSPIPSGQTPRPFSYNDQSENNDLSLGQASAQLNSLPPLKPNYSKYVKPLESNTTPIFLPTPLQTLSTSTAKVEPVSDQLISSTTIQPDVNGQEDPKTQSIQEETESPSTTPQPLETEVFHQSELTVQPTSVQSTTYLPFVTNEPQSIFFQYSTPQPTIYQSSPRPTPPPTPRPTPRLTPQRHEVVIQQQEIQELIFEPQPSSTPRYQKQPAPVFTPEPEINKLLTHPHYQLFEQLLPFKQEYQDIHSPQQYIVEARESQQKPVSALRGKPQQYLIQQHSTPVLQFRKQLLQGQQPELEQSQQQQQVLYQPYQQQEPNQAHQQQVFERARQQSEQAHQEQQHALEQTQHQQAQQQQAQQQKQEAEQAQQQIQESEQALQQQYQPKSLESYNQIQISTLTPPQKTEKQTETVEIQQQTEPHPELQQDSKLQSSTGKPDEQPQHLSEHTTYLEQPYLGPYLTPSVVPQLNSHQQLVAQPDLSPLLGVPSYSDVQYFGKFAETFFGNH